MDLEKVLQDARQCLPLSKETRKIARNQLSQDGILLILVGMLDANIESLRKRLETTSLVTDQGVRTALELQGTIKGIKNSIATVMMMAEEEFIQ